MSDASRIRIADAGKHVGEEVQLAGWLYNLRKSGKIVFPQLRDGTGIMQCVGVKSELPEEVFETLKHLTQESSLILTGRFARSSARPAGTNSISQAWKFFSASTERSVSDHPEGTRHRLPDGPPASVAPQPAPARHHPRASRSHQGHPRLLR